MPVLHTGYRPPSPAEREVLDAIGRAEAGVRQLERRLAEFDRELDATMRRLSAAGYPIERHFRSNPQHAAQDLRIQEGRPRAYVEPRAGTTSCPGGGRRSRRTRSGAGDARARRPAGPD